MPESIKELHEEIQKAHGEFKTYVDQQLEEVRKAGHSSSDTVEKVEKINEQLTKLTGQYDELRTKMDRPEGDHAAAGGEEAKEMELRKSAFVKMLRHGAGENGRSMMSADEIRALSSSSDADGGFIVPVDYESEIIKQAYNDAEVRPICNVASTGRDTVQMPALSKPTVAWGTANLAVSPQELAAGAERITINPLKALVLISNDTLDDSDANVWAELSEMFGGAVSEGEDDAFAVAPGVNSPKGFAGDSRVQANYTPTGVAAALTDASNNGVDALIAMLHSLKKAYRRNSTWAMNSTVEGTIRTLKDSNGQYLWQPPVQAGNPALLLGRPIINPESMPDVAANAFPIVLGDFRKGYKIRDRAGITIQRLSEKYAEYDQTGFLLKRRVGGQVTLPEAFVCLKVATS